MKEENDNRNKWLHVRLTEEEFRAIGKNYAGTTEPNLSEYVRKMVLGKPMIRAVRNQSLQDIVSELLQLRKDLNGVANNFNQAVKKLHSMRDHSAIGTWLMSFKLDEKSLLRSVETMREFISKTSGKWLQG